VAQTGGCSTTVVNTGVDHSGSSPSGPCVPSLSFFVPLYTGFGLSPIQLHLSCIQKDKTFQHFEF
jgi:hypothetical protein